MQTARESGRDIMQVNIAAIRDKFVGESEKNINGMFPTLPQIREFCRSESLRSSSRSLIGF